MPDKQSKIDWHKMADRLADGLRCASIECGELHHYIKDRHKGGEACPVVERINDALNDYDQKSRSGKETR